MTTLTTNQVLQSSATYARWQMQFRHWCYSLSRLLNILMSDLVHCSVIYSSILHSCMERVSVKPLRRTLAYSECLCISGWQQGHVGNKTASTETPTSRLGVLAGKVNLYGIHKKCSAVGEIGDRLATIDRPMGRKLGGSAPLGGAGSPSNTMWPGPRPTSVPSGILIHSTICLQHTNVTDKQDRQLSNSIGWTVLQTVVQKLVP